MRRWTGGQRRVAVVKKSNIESTQKEFFERNKSLLAPTTTHKNSQEAHNKVNVLPNLQRWMYNGSEARIIQSAKRARDRSVSMDLCSLLPSSSMNNNRNKTPIVVPSSDEDQEVTCTNDINNSLQGNNGSVEDTPETDSEKELSDDEEYNQEQIRFTDEGIDRTMDVYTSKYSKKTLKASQDVSSQVPGNLPPLPHTTQESQAPSSKNLPTVKPGPPSSFHGVSRSNLIEILDCGAEPLVVSMADDAMDLAEKPLDIFTPFHTQKKRKLVHHNNKKGTAARSSAQTTPVTPPSTNDTAQQIEELRTIIQQLQKENQHLRMQLKDNNNTQE